jgi:hypothetical protein
LMVVECTTKKGVPASRRPVSQSAVLEFDGALASIDWHWACGFGAHRTDQVSQLAAISAAGEVVVVTETELDGGCCTPNGDDGKPSKKRAAWNWLARRKGSNDVSSNRQRLPSTWVPGAMCKGIERASCAEWNPGGTILAIGGEAISPNAGASVAFFAVAAPALSARASAAVPPPPPGAESTAASSARHDRPPDAHTRHTQPHGPPQRLPDPPLVLLDRLQLRGDRVSAGADLHPCQRFVVLCHFAQTQHIICLRQL